VQVRPYSPEDEPELLDFARSVPDEDRKFLKEDASDAGVVEGWSEQSGVARFLAWADASVVGYVALHPLGGWSDHVAEMRVLVAPEARAHGYGQRLVRQALAAAVAAGTSKVLVEVIADHDQTLGMLQANGFSPEALLVDHVRDRTGQLRDLMVLTCRIDELVDDLTVTGIQDALELSS
jgi:ribosomal protein S18 acetylase RimI-like enzyme